MSSSPSDLEARIAALDDKLRLARQDNDALKGRLAPTTTTAAKASNSKSPPSNAATSVNTNLGGAAPTGTSPDANIRQATTHQHQQRQQTRSSSQSPTRPTSTSSQPRGTMSSSPLTYSPTRYRVTTPTPPTASTTSPYQPPLTSSSPASSLPPTDNGLAASPWRVVSRRTLHADDDAIRQHLDAQHANSSGLTHDIHDKHRRLEEVNRALVEKGKEVRDRERQRDVAQAQNTHEVDAIESRLASLDTASRQTEAQLQDMEMEKMMLLRQVEETKLAISRADARHAELTKEHTALDSHLHALESKRKEFDEATALEAQQFKQLRTRLEERIARLEEENKVATDRLRALEHQHALQERNWADTEESLRRESEEAAALLSEMDARSEGLKAELTDREKEAEHRKQQREQRQREITEQRARDRQNDLDKMRQANATRMRELHVEREEVLAALRHELDAITVQLDRKKREKESQDQLCEELETRLGNLEAQVEQKQRLEEQSDKLEHRLSELHVEHQQKLLESREVLEQISAKEDSIADLERRGKGIQHKMQEEKHLKGLLAQLAREVSDCAQAYDAERAAMSREQDQRGQELTELELERRAIDADIHAVREAGAMRLDALNRQHSDLRHQLADKEALLNAAISENAAKQAAIAQFEEEKRRMEREQLARKAAAAEAARAALSELAY